MLISLLIFIIVAALIWWLVGMLPIPEPFKTIIMVILIVILILKLLAYL
jgi:hypothetical protein